MIKTILELNNKILEVLSTCDEFGSTLLKEGRANSLIDEKNIINILKENEELKQYIDKEYDTLRGTGDINFNLNGEIYPYNIKTYKDTQIGSSDNAFSKLAFLYAFTDLDIRKIPKAISWTQLTNYILKYKKEVDRDYQYLVCSKSSFKKCCIRGMKQINLWHTNPSNILQINWVKELQLPPNNLTFEESYDIITSKIIESLKKDIDGKKKFIGLKND